MVAKPIGQPTMAHALVAWLELSSPLGGYRDYLGMIQGVVFSCHYSCHYGELNGQQNEKSNQSVC